MSLPPMATISTSKAPVACQGWPPMASGTDAGLLAAPDAAATNSSQFFGTGTPASSKALFDSHSHCQEWMLTGTQ